MIKIGDDQYVEVAEEEIKMLRALVSGLFDIVLGINFDTGAPIAMSLNTEASPSNLPWKFFEMSVRGTHQDFYGTKALAMVQGILKLHLDKIIKDAERFNDEAFEFSAAESKRIAREYHQMMVNIQREVKK